MSSVLKITVQGLEEMVKRLTADEENLLRAQVKAHSQAAAEGARMLKRGVSYRAGRDPQDGNYQASSVGSLPYGHTMRLGESIGFKILAKGKTVVSEVGRVANDTGAEYAKYLEGKDENGICPFLEHAEGYYNPETVKAYFNEFYQPLQGDK